MKCVLALAVALAVVGKLGWGKVNKIYITSGLEKKTVPLFVVYIKYV